MYGVTSLVAQCVLKVNTIHTSTFGGRGRFFAYLGDSRDLTALLAAVTVVVTRLTLLAPVSGAHRAEAVDASEDTSASGRALSSSAVHVCLVDIGALDDDLGRRILARGLGSGLDGGAVGTHSAVHEVLAAHWAALDPVAVGVPPCALLNV